MQIMGVDCPKCRRLMADVTAAGEQLNLEAEVGRIDDPFIIARTVIFTPPRWMIDDRLTPLEEQYGESWQLSLIELHSARQEMTFVTNRKRRRPVYFNVC